MMHEEGIWGRGTCNRINHDKRTLHSVCSIVSTVTVLAADALSSLPFQLYFCNLLLAISFTGQCIWLNWSYRVLSVVSLYWKFGAVTNQQTDVISKRRIKAKAFYMKNIVNVLLLVWGHAFFPCVLSCWILLHMFLELNGCKSCTKIILSASETCIGCYFWSCCIPFVCIMQITLTLDFDLQ